MFLLDGLVVVTMVTYSWKFVKKHEFLLHGDCELFVELVPSDWEDKLAIRALTSHRGLEKKVIFYRVRGSFVVTCTSQWWVATFVEVNIGIHLRHNSFRLLGGLLREAPLSQLLEARLTNLFRLPNYSFQD